LLPPERRYDGLMVANAMAIAAREAGQGEAPLREAMKLLSALFPASAHASEDKLPELESSLAREIRAGRCDTPGPHRDAVRAYLRWSTTARLRISNPKALADPSA
jgi:hypothetical protein